MPKYIFIGFGNADLKTDKDKYKLSGEIELWNLKQISYSVFIKSIRKIFPPIGPQTEANYEKQENGQSPFGITENQYNKCTWGILLPNIYDNGIDELRFIMDLYCGVFLYPFFLVNNLGVNVLAENLNKPPYDPSIQNQNQFIKFNSENFMKFLNIFSQAGQFSAWHALRVTKWEVEDFRMFTASMIYQGLSKYYNSKPIFMWQREMADISMLLENLFTAQGSVNTEIGYRLRQKITLLLQDKYPEINSKMKNLYDLRSEFVHGSFFNRMKKSTKTVEGLGDLPKVEWQLLHETFEFARYALIICLYLHINRSLISDNQNQGYESVINMIEDSILDIDIREKVLMKANNVIRLRP